VDEIYSADCEQTHAGAMVVTDTYPTKETILAAMDQDPTISTIDQYKRFRAIAATGLDAYGVPYFLPNFGKQQTAVFCSWHFDSNEASLERPTASVINGRLGGIRVQLKTLFEGTPPKAKTKTPSRPHSNEDEDE